MARLGLRAYARHRAASGLPGGTLAAVQKALASGRITTDADGRIDPVAADRAWEANTNPLHRPAASQPPDPALTLFLACDNVVNEILAIEDRLSETFGATFRHNPETPAAPWQALYAEWGRIVDVLAELQGAAKMAAAHLPRKR